MKIEEVLEKIKNMNLFDKLDFLMKVYNEVEDKKSLEDLIKKTVDEISSERTPIFTKVEFKKIKEERRSPIEEKVENETRVEKKEEERREIKYVTGPKFIEKEDEVFWVGENLETRYAKKYKAPEIKENYKVIW